MFDMTKVPAKLVLKNSVSKRLFCSDNNRTRVVGTTPCIICSNYSLNWYVEVDNTSTYSFTKIPDRQ